MILPFLLMGQKRSKKKEKKDTKQLTNSKYQDRKDRKTTSERRFITNKKYGKNSCSRPNLEKLKRKNLKALSKGFKQRVSKYDVNKDDVNKDEFTADKKIKVPNVYKPNEGVNYFSGTTKNLYYKEVSFTGVIYDTFQSGAVRNQVQYQNGVIEGLSSSWYENGKMNFRKRFINGKADIPSKSWYVDGQKKSDVIKIDKDIFSDSTMLFGNITVSGNSDLNTHYDSLRYSLLLDKSKKNRQEIEEFKTRFNSMLDNDVALMFEYNNLFEDLADQDVALCNYINSLDLDKLLKIFDRYKAKGKLGKKKMKIYLDYFDEKRKVEDIEKLILLKADDIKFNNNMIGLSKGTLSDLENESKDIMMGIRNERAKDIYKADQQYTYWYENGIIIKKGIFINQRKYGLYQEWYEDGQKTTEGHYTQGLKNGLWEEWYKKGQIKSRYIYTAGEEDGLCEDWYENGQKKYHCKYENSQQVSAEKKWSENSKRVSIVNYNLEGKKHGGVEYWHANGRKEVVGNYIDGKRDGVWKWWYENGQLELRLSYDKGDKINRDQDKRYNEDGSVQKPPPAKVEPLSKAHNYIRTLGLQLNGRMMLFSGNWPHYIWYAHAWYGSGYTSTLKTFYLITHDAGNTFEINFE